MCTVLWYCKFACLLTLALDVCDRCFGKCSPVRYPSKAWKAYKWPGSWWRKMRYYNVLLNAHIYYTDHQNWGSIIVYINKPSITLSHCLGLISVWRNLYFAMNSPNYFLYRCALFTFYVPGWGHCHKVKDTVWHVWNYASSFCCGALDEKINATRTSAC